MSLLACRAHRRARTRSCSAASRPTRSATGSTTPRRRCSSPATARGGAGTIVPLKETADVARRRVPEHREGARAAAHRARRPDDRGPRRLVARPRPGAERPTARPSRWTPRTSSTSSTRRGTTAKPKGIMHTTGGYLTQVAWTHQNVFDIRPDDRRVLVRGRRRLGHRPLVHRLRAAREPDDERDVRGHARLPRQGPALVDRREVRRDDPLHRAHRDPHLHEVGHRVPGAPRPVVAAPARHASASRSTPRRGSGTGSTSAVSRCPVVDTWWQTETGAIMISPLPGATTLKPGSATFPLPGHRRRRRRRRRRAASAIPGGGYLVLTRPWPSMLRGIWGDPERYRETYWSRFDGRYFAGDGAKRDDDGYFWLLGRVDDVMLVSGHNISTAEVEHALVGHPSVAEAAVVGTHRRDDGSGDRRVRDPAGRHRAERGARRRAARPRRAQASARSRSRRRSSSPRTCRRRARARSCAACCKDVSEDQALGDTTTLADPGVVESIKARYLAQPPATRSERRVREHGARALELARRPGRARAGGGRRHRRRALRRGQPPALPRGAAPRLARVLRRVR